MALKIATTQLPAREYGLQKIKKCLLWADDQRADIICFPEGYLNGYTRSKAEATERALDLSSRRFKVILRELEAFRATAIIGLIEAEDGRLYNTAIVVRDGRLMGKYRKTHPQEKIFEAGTEYPVFNVRSYRFGLNICYDANFPEASQKLADQNADIIFYLLNNELNKESAEKWRYKHIENLINRATGAGVIAVSSDVVVKTEATKGYGCTAVVEKDGRIIAKANEFEETTLLEKF